MLRLGGAHPLLRAQEGNKDGPMLRDWNMSTSFKEHALEDWLIVRSVGTDNISCIENM